MGNNIASLQQHTIFLGTTFRKQFWEAAFGNNFRGSFSSFEEQLYSEQLYSEQLLIIILGAPLGNNFVEQVWEAGAALRGNFEQKL